MALNGMFDFPIDSDSTTEKVRGFMEAVASSGDVNPLAERRVSEVAGIYKDKYMRNLKNKYGFGDKELAMVEQDFEQVSGRIKGIIKNIGTPQSERYSKYLEMYPFMFFNAVPREVLESRLTLHAVEENNALRKQVTEMSIAIGHLVKNLADIQNTLRLPPIAKVVFEHLPDPLLDTANTSHAKYSKAMDVYHSIYTQLEKSSEQLAKFLGDVEAFLSNDINSLVSSGAITGVTNDDIATLKTIVKIK